MADSSLGTISSAAKLLGSTNKVVLDAANSIAGVIPGGKIALGATIAGISCAFQGGAWTASEFGKLGKSLGAPGEFSAAVLGISPGAIGGFFVGFILGTLSGENMVNYFRRDLK